MDITFLAKVIPYSRQPQVTFDEWNIGLSIIRNQAYIIEMELIYFIGRKKYERSVRKQFKMLKKYYDKLSHTFIKLKSFFNIMINNVY